MRDGPDGRQGAGPQASEVTGYARRSCSRAGRLARTVRPGHRRSRTAASRSGQVRETRGITRPERRRQGAGTVTVSESPGELTHSRIVALPGGELAEAVVTERAEAFARWRAAGGPWSPWQMVAEGARDISLTPDSTSPQEPAVLIAAVTWTALPLGAYPVMHTFYTLSHFRLSASGVTPADL